MLYVFSVIICVYLFTRERDSSKTHKSTHAIKANKAKHKDSRAAKAHNMIVEMNVLNAKNN